LQQLLEQADRNCRHEDKSMQIATATVSEVGALSRTCGAVSPGIAGRMRAGGAPHDEIGATRWQIRE